MQSILINKLQYFRKVLVGESTSSKSKDLPIQLVYPNGNIHIGMPQSADNNRAIYSNDHNVVVVSGPEKFAVDFGVREGLTASLMIVCFVNIILTGLMFNKASTVDPSKVVPFGGTVFINI